MTEDLCCTPSCSAQYMRILQRACLTHLQQHVIRHTIQPRSNFQLSNVSGLGMRYRKPSASEGARAGRRRRAGSERSLLAIRREIDAGRSRQAHLECVLLRRLLKRVEACEWCERVKRRGRVMVQEARRSDLKLHVVPCARRYLAERRQRCGAIRTRTYSQAPPSTRASLVNSQSTLNVLCSYASIQHARRSESQAALGRSASSQPEAA